MKRQHLATLIAGLVLVGAGATACGDDEPSTEEATAEVCDARESIDDTVTSLGHLDPSDAGDLDATRDQLGDEVDELASAAQVLAESEWDDVESAVDDFRDTVGEIDGDTSFSEAAAQLTDARDQLSDAWDSFTSRVSC